MDAQPDDVPRRAAPSPRTAPNPRTAPMPRMAPMPRAAATLLADGAPSLPLYLSEPARAAAEYWAFLACAPLLAALPRGDKHPVLVLPGLLANDTSTLVLRLALRTLGYPVVGWQLGPNLGPTERAVRGMRERLDGLVQQHGRPASVIGWSLGGIFARELARHAPDDVRQVITLGSPFRLAHGDQTRAHAVFQRFSHLHVEQWELPLEHGRLPLRAPATSIYSALDGIVSWKACVDAVTPRSENIEVFASHLGLGHHPAVLWAVADRLAQPEGGWRPFRPPTLLAAAYGRPHDARHDPQVQAVH
jgi:pimeloyl-ACP methyl ester carboxylesterase